MVKHPLFSILLPTNNRADVIGYAIQSVLQQTCKDFELLIVGDGCTDNTEQVVAHFIKKDKRIHWHSFAKGQGFGYENRNTVLRQAKGTYIAYMGHDDIWLPNHLEKHLAYYRKNPGTHIAYSRPLWFSDRAIILRSNFATTAPYIRDIFLNDHNEIPAICFTYKRSATDSTGLWNKSKIQAGDWYLWKRIMKSDPRHTLGFIPTPTTVNFKSVWRSPSKYLNDHLNVMEQIILSSSTLRKSLTIPRLGNTPQASLWKFIDSPRKLAHMLKMVESAQDELVYRLTAKIALMKQDATRVSKVVSTIKKTRLYKSYNTVRTYIVRTQMKLLR